MNPPNSGRVILPERFDLPPFPKGTSSELLIAIENAFQRHKKWSEAVVKEAGALRKGYEPMMVRASIEVVSAWLAMIAPGVRFAPSQDDFIRRATSLHFAAEIDVPHVAWTRATQREGLRAWKEFPSVHEVFELIMPPVRGLVGRVRSLRVISGIIQQSH